MYERNREQALDRLLAQEPGAAQLLAQVKDSLAKAINLTDETTGRCYSLIEKLERRELL